MLTDMEIAILLHASRFLYVTNSQFLRLGVGTNLRVIARKTKHLTETPNSKSPFLGVLKYPPSARTGRVEHVYYLTERGSHILRSLFPQDSFPFLSSPGGYFRDYRHRFACVQVHIALSQWLKNDYADLNLVFWQRYFEKTGANRSRQTDNRLHALTRVELSEDRFIIPDIAFLVRRWNAESGGLLLALEVSNGMDTKRVLEQVNRHMDALELGAMGKKYGLSIGHKVVFVFLKTALMESVRMRFLELSRAKDFYDFFLFTTEALLLDDATNCFWKAKKGDGPYHLLSGKKLPASGSFCSGF